MRFHQLALLLLTLSAPLAAQPARTEGRTHVNAPHAPQGWGGGVVPAPPSLLLSLLGLGSGALYAVRRKRSGRAR